MSTFRFDPIDLPPECEALRREVRGFIADELGAGLWRPNSDFGSHRSAEFSRRLGARGWIGMTWPKRYGGGERSFLERYVVTEELLAAGAPVGSHWIADRQSGPLLLRFGTEDQRDEFLPGITRGEIFFSIGMSEPDSGSDLASIRTRAVPVSGGYEVTGAKVWTSYAHESHYAITLVRTGDAGASRHQGLTQLILDLKAPGVTIRPIRNLAGEHDFNEIALDRVFVRKDRLVGAEGDGWTQVTSELAFERSGPERFLSSHQVLRGLVARAGDQPEPQLAEALGRMAASLWTLRNMSLSVAGMLQAGETPNLEAALVKDCGNAYEREVPEIARLVLPGGRRGDRDDAELALAEAVLHAPSWTLRGGTREILRGIIARGLGLR
ncbi:MAG TPA: acyl-CoA dehydrogenase family protein [Stellaceae bacterium]|nr:acyl-CoA dehydrogenase family protein [Stellaceae bacterium]